MIEKIKKYFRWKKMVSLATEEAKLLKKHLTQVEKDRLYVSSFRPKQRDGCIYGLATGDCYSGRASELIQLCAKRSYVYKDPVMLMESCVLNGKITKARDMDEYFSPIEILIVQGSQFTKKSNGQAIINYLRGVSEHLKFTKS
jgi:hypothetical protein